MSHLKLEWALFLEFYDFSIFGFYALYFAPKIFPYVNISAYVDIFSIFALGYCMKPFGILIFQKLSLRLPLRRILNISIVIMAISFLSIATVPIYDSIGIWSGVIILCARLLQGIASGIEMQCIIKYLSSTLTMSKRNMATSAILLAISLGIFLGVMLNRGLIQYFNDFQLEDWGWRIPFYLGAILSLLSCIIRISSKKSEITPKYLQHKVNIFTIFIKYKKRILLIAGMVGINATLLMSGIIFMPIYLHSTLNLNYFTISNILFKATILSVIASLITHYLSKIINPTFLIKLTYLGIIITIIYCYHCFATGKNMSMAVYQIAILYSTVSRLTPLAIPKDIFPSYLRLTCVSTATHIGFMLFGVTYPLSLALILSLSHSVFIAPCIYIIMVTCISITCIFILPKS